MGGEAFHRALPTEQEWARLTEDEQMNLSQLVETGSKQFGIIGGLPPTLSL